MRPFASLFDHLRKRLVQRRDWSLLAVYAIFILSGAAGLLARESLRHGSTKNRGVESATADFVPARPPEEVQGTSVANAFASKPRRFRQN